jgi:predicted nucleic acid-binding protein
VPEVFVDTSSLVKFYYPEKDSDKIEEYILGAKKVFFSSLSVVEMSSALMKKVRSKELRKSEEMLIWKTFLDDIGTEQMEMIVPNEKNYYRAADLIREFGSRHGIRTLDALQLAVALGTGNTLFLCSDRVLSAVAEVVGMRVVA